MEVLAELTEVPGIVARSYITTQVPDGYKKCCTRTPGIVARGVQITEVPGTGMKVLQNCHKFRVLWHGRTELTEVPGSYKNAVPVPRVLWQGRTDLTEVPGPGMNVVQNSHKFFVRAWMLHRTPQKFRVRVIPVGKYTPSGEELDLK